MPVSIFGIDNFMFMPNLNEPIKKLIGVVTQKMAVLAGSLNFLLSLKLL